MIPKLTDNTYSHYMNGRVMEVGNNFQWSVVAASIVEAYNTTLRVRPKEISAWGIVGFFGYAHC